MPRLELDVETSLPPERVRDAILDFSERRPELWPGIDPSLYEVYSVGETSADVREGTKLPFTRIWARERYDWSTPGTIRWTVTESNFSTPGSYVEATLNPREAGGTSVHVVWERTGTTLVGRLLIRLIALSRGKPIGSSIEKTLHRLESDAEAPGVQPSV
jgi:hypothetical protein